MMHTASATLSSSQVSCSIGVGKAQAIVVRISQNAAPRTGTHEGSRNVPSQASHSLNR